MIKPYMEIFFCLDFIMKTFRYILFWYYYRVFFKNIGSKGEKMPSFSSFLKKWIAFFMVFFFLIFIWLHQVLTAACGIYIPHQELNPSPLHWSSKS